MLCKQEIGNNSRSQEDEIFYASSCQDEYEAKVLLDLTNSSGNDMANSGTTPFTKYGNEKCKHENLRRR